MADIGYTQQAGATVWQAAGASSGITQQTGATVWITATVPGYVQQAGATVWIRPIGGSNGVSASMLAHLAQSVTTLCTLWAVTATDGTVRRYCNHTRNLTYNGQTYYAIPLRPTSVQVNAGLDPGNAEIDAPLILGGFEENDLLNGKWNFARVEMLVVNYNDTSMGWARRNVGYLGEISVGNGTFRAEFRSLADLLNQPIGDTYEPLCPYTLGDTRCTKSLASFTHAGTVSVVDTGDRAKSIFTTNVSQADDYFTLGKCTFTSGANSGLSMEIKKQIGTRIILAKPMPSAIVAAVTVTLIAGCNKTRAQCRDKFANAANFGGFPDLPGPDAVFKYPE